MTKKEIRQHIEEMIDFAVKPNMQLSYETRATLRQLVKLSIWYGFEIAKTEVSQRESQLRKWIREN